MRPRILTLLVAFLTTSTIFLAACGEDNVLSPQFEPEVANLTDSFQFQATDVTDITQTLSYSWETTGISANINQSCALTGGTAVIEVRDSQNQLVYTGNLADDGTFESSEGATGSWNVRLILTDVSGTLNFRLEKRA